MKYSSSTADANFLKVLTWKVAYYQVEIAKVHKHETAFEFSDNV